MMQELLIHLIKSAGLLTLFFAGYFFLLKEDTSFKTNRAFLLVGILTSVLLPFLEITRTVVVEATATPIFTQDFSGIAVSEVTVEARAINWWRIAGTIYLVGLGFFLLKFFIELFTLLKLIFTNKISREKDFYLIQKCGNKQPFSFFKFIVIDPEQHSPTEQELILKHERCHARQWHSLDQLLASLCVYLLWFNPLSWLYRKAIVQNLEFLADQEVIAAQVSKKEYQQALLRISIADFPSALTSQFYQSFIKKRIVMLNKKSTQKLNFWKVFLLMPFLLLFMFSFNVKTEERIAKDPGDLFQSGHSIEEDLFVTITKTTTKETMDILAAEFEKKDILLTFEKLQFSPEGFITHLVTSIRTTDFKQGQVLDKTNAEGIKDFVIYAKENGKIGFGEAPSSETGDTHSGLHKIGLNALIIVNGKIFEPRELAGKSILFDGGVQTLAPDEATIEYGEKAAEGVLVITNGDIIDIRDTKEMHVLNTPTGTIRNYLSIEEETLKRTVVTYDQQHANIGIGNNRNDGSDKVNKAQEVQFRTDTTKINAIQRNDASPSYFLSQEEKPLIIVDGEVKENSNYLESLDPDTIKSMNVLKGKAALDKYGERAKNGAIEIQIKTTGEDTGQNSEGIKIRSKTDPVKVIGYGDSTGGRLTIRNIHEAEFPNFLYFVDGKEMDEDFGMEKINLNNIQSISVLKGPAAIKIYGEKAKAGAILITTKK